MHEEFVKQKSGFQSRIQSRDEEINRLRSQVVLRSVLRVSGRLTSVSYTHLTLPTIYSV